MGVNRRSFLAGGTLFAAGALADLATPASPRPALPPKPRKPPLKGEETFTPPPVVKGITRVVAEPVLQCPAPDSMGIAWAVNGLANGAVEFADNPQLQNASTVRCGGFGMTAFDDQAIQVRLTGLRPGTRYWYRTITTPIAVYKNAYSIQLGEPETGAVHSFTTPDASVPARFCVINDTHAVWKQFEPITRKLLEIKPALTVWNGDATNTTEEKKTAVEIFLNPPVSRKDYAADIPILFLNGNHDFRGKWIRHLDEVMMPRLPSERAARDWDLKRNFAFRLGDVAMIGLDTGEDKPDWHPKWMGLANFAPYREAQAVWLRDVLARPDIDSAPYIVAFCHIPLFDANPDANPGDRFENWADWRKDCADLWGPLFAKHGVQLVVAAHKHRYRFDPATADRPWAQIVGGGPGRTAQHFPTVIEGAVEGGQLKLTVHNVLTGEVVGTHAFKPRKTGFLGLF